MMIDLLADPKLDRYTLEQVVKWLYGTCDEQRGKVHTCDAAQKLAQILKEAP